MGCSVGHRLVAGGGTGGTWWGRWGAMGTMGWGWGQPKGDNVTPGPTSPPVAPIAHRAICGAQVGGWGGGQGGTWWGRWGTMGTPIGGQWDTMGTMGWGWGQPKGDNVMLGPTSPPAPITHGALCGAQVGGWGGGRGDMVGMMGRHGDKQRGMGGWGRSEGDG